MALVGNILLGTGSAPAVSSIASAYAESAASSRIPWSALEYSGQTITSISGSAIGGQGGGGDTSQCMPKSASADFILTSQSSQFITSTAGLQPSGDYAFNSALSSYLPTSASGDFAPSGDYAYNSALSSKLDESAFTAYTATATGGSSGHTYIGVSPIVVDNTADIISLSATAMYFDSSMRTYTSGASSFIGMAYPMEFVSNSSQATGSNILYVVIGG